MLEHFRAHRLPLHIRHTSCQRPEASGAQGGTSWSAGETSVGKCAPGFAAGAPPAVEVLPTRRGPRRCCLPGAAPAAIGRGSGDPGRRLL